MPEPELTTFTCDSCGAQHTGQYPDLTRLGWRRYALAAGGFLMCGACEALYGTVWATREQEENHAA